MYNVTKTVIRSISTLSLSPSLSLFLSLSLRLAKHNRHFGGADSIGRIMYTRRWWVRLGLWWFVSSPSGGVTVLALAARRSGRQLSRALRRVLVRVDADAWEAARNHVRVAALLLAGFEAGRGQRGGAFGVHARGAPAVEHQTDDQAADDDAAQHGQHDDDGQVGRFDVQRLRQDLARLHRSFDGFFGPRRVQFVVEARRCHVSRHEVAVHFQ